MVFKAWDEISVEGLRTGHDLKVGGEVGHDLKVRRKIRWNQKVMSLKSGKGTISERENYQLTNESGKRRAE